MFVQLLPPSVDLKIRLVSWRESTTAFIHAGYTNIARGEITRHLYISNKGRLGAHHDRAMPCGASVT